MDWQTIGTLLFGGSIFSVVTWYITWKAGKIKRQNDDTAAASDTLAKIQKNQADAINTMQNNLNDLVTQNSELFKEVVALRQSNAELQATVNDISAYLEEIKELYQKDTGKPLPKRRKKGVNNDARLSQ